MTSGLPGTAHTGIGVVIWTLSGPESGIGMHWHITASLRPARPDRPPGHWARRFARPVVASDRRLHRRVVVVALPQAPQAACQAPSAQPDRHLPSSPSPPLRLITRHAITSAHHPSPIHRQDAHGSSSSRHPSSSSSRPSMCPPRPGRPDVVVVVRPVVAPPPGSPPPSGLTRRVWPSGPNTRIAPSTHFTDTGPRP